MKSLIAAPLTFVVFLSATCSAECKKGLGEQVDDVHISEDSTLAALLRFGYERGVCMGVENPGDDLLGRPVRLEASHPTVSYTLQVLLGAGRYQISEQHRVILIRNMEAVGHDTELDIGIREFKTERISVSWASLALFVRLVMLADPSLQGFAGNLSDRVPDDKVGPFDEHGRTTRDILTLIVGQSAGGAWVSGQCSGPTRSAKGPCWNSLEFQEERGVADSVIREIVRKRKQERSEIK